MALEFALVLPLFLVVLTGIIGYGQWFSTRIAVIHAASEGARAAVAGLSDAERRDLATAQARQVAEAYEPLIDPARLTVTTSTPSAGVFGITVAYPLTGFPTLVPMPSGPVQHTALVSYGGY